MRWRGLAVAVSAVVLVGSVTATTAQADANGRTAASVRSEAASSAQKMNLRQIARGNFKSLTGRRWVQTAYGSSHFDRPGFYPGGASKLTVSRTRITMNQRFVIRGRYLSDGQGLTHAKLSFSRRGKILVAVLKDQSVAINYSVEFYPRGVPLRLRMKAYGVKISSRKNRIVFWSSNNGFTQIFSQR